MASRDRADSSAGDVAHALPPLFNTHGSWRSGTRGSSAPGSGAAAAQASGGPAAAPPARQQKREHVDVFTQAATAYPPYLACTHVNATSVAEDPSAPTGGMARFMASLGDALELVEDSGLTSDMHLPSDEQDVRVAPHPSLSPGDILLSPAAAHAGHVARGHAQAYSVAFATRSSAAAFKPPPLPSNKYPPVSRATFAGHITRLRQARVAAGLPPTPLNARHRQRGGGGGGARGPESPAPRPAAPSHDCGGVVPAMFFEEDFSLAHPDTFRRVISHSFGPMRNAAGEEGGQEGGQEGDEGVSVDVPPAVQHALSTFLDSVEADLAHRIAARKEHLFAALVTLHTLWDAVVQACGKVASTKAALARSRGCLSSAGLRVLALRRRMARAAALRRRLAALREVATARKLVLRLSRSGEHGRAVAACRALRSRVLEQCSGLKCAASLLDAVDRHESAVADGLSRAFTLTAMQVMVSGVTPASTLDHLGSAAASPAAVQAYLAGWLSRRQEGGEEAGPPTAPESPAGSQAPTPVAEASLLAQLEGGGSAACEAMVLQFTLRPQLQALCGLSAGTLLAALETLQSKATAEIKSLVVEDIVEGLRVLDLRQAADAALVHRFGSAEQAASGAGDDVDVFGYAWQAAGGPGGVSVGKIKALSFPDFAHLFLGLLATLTKVLTRCAAIVRLLQQVLKAAPHATESLPADEASSLQLAAQDIIVTACDAGQRQVSKLLKARRAVHDGLRVGQAALLVTAAEAFANMCTRQSADVAGDLPVPGALGGSDLVLEAHTQADQAFSAQHARSMLELPSVMHAEVWRHVSVQPSLHSALYDLAVPSLLSEPAVQEALPTALRALAGRPRHALRSLLRAQGVADSKEAQESASSAYDDGEGVFGATLGLHLAAKVKWSPPTATSESRCAVHLAIAKETPAEQGDEQHHSELQQQMADMDPPPPSTRMLHVPRLGQSGVAVTGAVADNSAATLSLHTQPFCVSASALILLKHLATYAAAARLMPMAVAGDAALRAAELLRCFNDTASALVLGGEAVSRGTLKTIFAKHLAVAATSLRAVSAIVPLLRGALVASLPSAKHTLLRELWKVAQDFDKHVDRIFAKFAAILQDTFKASLGKLGEVDWNAHTPAFDAVYPLLVADAQAAAVRSSSGAPAQAISESAATLPKGEDGSVWGHPSATSARAAPTSPHMQGVIKHTATLHKILGGILSPEDLCEVFSRVAVMLSEQLPVQVVSAAFSALSTPKPEDGDVDSDGLSDYGRKRLAWDVIGLLLTLRQVPGLGTPTSSDAAAADEWSAGQVALSSVRSWVGRHFGVAVSPAL